mmetsp:Transcript_1464/g.3044  ORF Transcript_1464/g.3044 Transcript_1464/m.3044 type:complete len:234 (-) Transcript_1464:1942-2643(-)
MLQDLSHRSGSLLGIRMEDEANQVSGCSIVIIGNVSQSLPQTILVPHTDLRNLGRAHGPFSTAGVGTKRQSRNAFVQNYTVRPNVVRRLSGHRHNACIVALLAHWIASLSLFQSNRFRWVVKSTRWIRWSAKRDTSSHSEHLPTTSKLSNVVGSEITMYQPVFVKVEQRNSNSLDSLLGELLAILSHVQHEILGSGIGSFHGNTVPGLSHGFRVGRMLNRVMDANHGGNVVPR